MSLDKHNDNVEHTIVPAMMPQKWSIILFSRFKFPPIVTAARLLNVVAALSVCT